MKIIIKILIGVLALVLAAIGGLYLTGNGMLLTIFWATTMGGPSLPFDETEAVDHPVTLIRIIGQHYRLALGLKT